jgi:microsomal dipeptidase-like Zn-dependent dipeptidase
MHLFALALLLFSSNTFASFPDLHVHLFMEHGVGAIFRGEFTKPLKAKNWKAMMASKINEETLKASTAPLVVAALYAHPVLVAKKGPLPSDWVKNSIRAQVAAAREFVARNPNWILATNATQAQIALQNNKRILLLSLEGAHGIFGDDKDFIEFIDELGISIVTPLHLINTKYGGAAYMKGLRKTIFTTRIFARQKVEEVKVNSQGLTKKGEELIKKLIAKKVWIDLSHASDRTTWAIIPMLIQNNMPLLYTHTSLRRYLKAERGLSEWAMMEIKRHGGYVGLVPSEEMLVNTPMQQQCAGPLQALGRHYDDLTREIGVESVAIGSDFNGGIPHLGPHDCGDHGDLLGKNGLKSAAQWQLLWNGMIKSGAQLSLDPLAPTREFLRQWSLVRP